MPYRYTFRTIATIAFGALLLTATAATGADDMGDAEPLALRAIMHDLGEHMQAVTDGISREDWELVQRTAPLIAGHPEPPPAEKVRILTLLGPDAGKFRGYDQKAAEAAHRMATAAASKDGEAVIDAFHAVQTSCFGCHREFREPIVRHFYGGK